jgi:phenylalanyl-tRNA synthetase beta chain
MLQKEQKGKVLDKDASEEILYKIDIPANRYDMLCLEGVARALNIFNKRVSGIKYRLANMRGAELHTLPVFSCSGAFMSFTGYTAKAEGCCGM